VDIDLTQETSAPARQIAGAAAELTIPHSGCKSLDCGDEHRQNMTAHSKHEKKET
jgi:hypothetical protein